MNVKHTVSLALDTAEFTDLKELVALVPYDAENVRMSTSTVSRGQGYGEYEAVTLEVEWS